MPNSYWVEQGERFLTAIEDVKIPNNMLDNVDSILVKNQIDLNPIPISGGCYWIWTNEQVTHSLHKKIIPASINNGEIIYNGITKDDVKGRISHHLFGDIDAGWSGISIDIYPGDSASHRKKAYAAEGKVPFINEIPIRTRDLLLQLNLSESERSYIQNSHYDKYFFRNGINITEDKHRVYDFKVFYITGVSTLYLEHIEKKWRELYGLPKLCSYSSGR